MAKRKATTKKTTSTTTQTPEPEPETNFALAAERVAVILGDPSTPTFLHDVLTDMINDLSGETGVGDFDPDIAHLLLSKAFPVAEARGLRQYNGVMRREGEE